MDKAARSLDLIEEWSTVDPSDLQAVRQEGRKLRFLISLLVKARDRDELRQAAQAEKDNNSIRRKAGLVL
jgi:hypothetical protein